MFVFTIDLSLANRNLYAGCEIAISDGQANLITPVQQAIEIVDKNVTAIVAAVPANQRDEVCLRDEVHTGLMAMLTYLVCFHAVLHGFRKVYYDDGKEKPVLIATNG